MFSREMLDTALERPWHKRDEAEELPRAWSDQGEDDVELDTEDETGFVSPLEPEPTA